jgi:hypothetical protein
LETEQLLIKLIQVIKSAKEYKELPKEYQQQLNNILNKDYLTNSLKTKSQGTILYQMKITLKSIRPPIWRRVVVPSHITFHQLHKVIQAAMGWEDYHLYEFEIGNIIIDLPEDELFPSFREKYDAKKTKISQFFIEEGQKCTYTYDFGDYWQHTILLEKTETSLTPLSHPTCLKGKRACPPEDIGGVYGYMQIVDMLNSTNVDEEIEHFFEWYGGEYDPEYFNIEEVNERLKSIRL